MINELIQPTYMSLLYSHKVGDQLHIINLYLHTFTSICDNEGMLFALVGLLN